MTRVLGFVPRIPCIAGTTFRRTNEKLGAETGDYVMSYKSVVAAVGMSRRACIYAFSNVLQEKLLKQGCTVKEALGILGAFGTLISVLQAWSLGWTRFVEVTWTSPMALSVLGFLTCFFSMYELVNLFAKLSSLKSDIPPRENSGTDVERLMDKFNLDLLIVARLGGLSAHISHTGKYRFPCVTVTYALIQMVEKIAEKSDKAKIITDGARTGRIYVKGSADFKEFGSETVIFASGDFDTDFTHDSLPATYRPDLLRLPIINGEYCPGDAMQVDDVLPKGAPPPGIGGVGFGSSPNLATDHIICELCPPSERGMGLSTNLAYPVSNEKYSGTCVSTDPVAEPAVMSFTVLLTGSIVVAAAAVETTYSESADCTDSSTSMCSGGVRVATQCGGGSFTPDGAYDSLWNSVKPMTGAHTINYSQCQEDVGCVCMLQQQRRDRSPLLCSLC